MSTQIPGSVGCYFVGCAHPVTGQCQGYPGRCGRFCCAQHSTVDRSKGLLCLECAHRLAVDRQEAERKEIQERLFQLYLNAAENVPRTNSFYVMIGWVLVYLGIAFCGCFVSELIHDAYGPYSDFFNISGGPIASILPIGGAVIAGIVVSVYSHQKRQKARIQIAQLTALLPDFDKFYAEWLKHKQAEERKEALLALFAAGIGIAAAASARERRISEIEEAVKKALR